MSEPLRALSEELEALIVHTNFSGAARISQRGALLYERAAGLADRGHLIPNTIGTQFGAASGVKGLTAVVTMSLVEEGLLTLDTSVRHVLGDVLAEIDSAVTVRHLLTHTSGIGDYLDEEEISDVGDYLLPIPVHQLETTADYVVVLDGRPMKSAPGERFAYNNSGFVVLALVCEFVSGTSFYDLVDERVCAPAGMTSTAFFRNDSLPGNAALGYLPDGDGSWRTNLFHLPMRGSGDGGLTTTVGDFDRFWTALFAGRILPIGTVHEMLTAHQDVPEDNKRYGLGFWLRADRETVQVEGYDPGISFRSGHDIPTGVTFTVVSNTSDGVWPIVTLLGDRLSVFGDD